MATIINNKYLVMLQLKKRYHQKNELRKSRLRLIKKRKPFKKFQ